ncbi:phage head-tail joining protein [Pararhodobacter sp.]|uniref:phage head-tail joining protein n=1 Tax=Pararhodobacter sp. TaxID=2127056 RepID=UPI002FDD55E8
MPDLTKLRDYREKLQEARFSGIRTIRDSNGEEVTYRSQAEMERAIAAIDAEISQLQRKRLSIVRFQTSKGV